MSVFWKPTETSIRESLIYQFAEFASQRCHHDLSSWDKLYNWSVKDLSKFWELCAEFVKIRWIHKPTIPFLPPPDTKMRGARWFVDGTLNYCENVLPPANDRTVLISLSEDQVQAPCHITGLQLHNEVARLALFLKEKGVKKNDVVCGVVCNTHHAIAAMLATSSLGAIWSSCSPDFGAEAIMDRLGQIEAKVCFFTESYMYNGQIIDCRSKIQSVLQKIPSLGHSISISGPLKDGIRTRNSYETIVGDALNEALPLEFVETAFDHPLFIMFSSGTTGVPKCIVHGVGGTLLQHKKEHLLHCNLQFKDRLFFFTTCGWMMWNWMVSGLASGASLLVYDGSPKILSQGLWEIVSDHEVTVFGTSPKFLSMSMNEGWCPRKDLKLSALRCILSTGSPLLPEHFEWVFENVGSQIHLASISGGTDILSCFMLGNPMLPVHSGEIQSPGLGMAIAAYDESGKPVINQKGELVCTEPFVSMPLYFLKDPDGSRYQNAYFSYFTASSKELWRHGDFISISPQGGITVHGRSDATLNPGGVRIGTSELYRCVESIDGIEDSLALSYEFAKGDPVVLLFVKTAPSQSWSQEFEKSLKLRIRKTLSPRHVPHSIFQVAEIPYTRNGKKLELAAKQALCNESIPNLSAVANPSCLEEYRNIGARF